MSVSIGLCYNVLMTRDGVLNVRLPEDVKRALRKAADADYGRSMSAMAVKILSEWLTAHDYLPPPAAKKPVSRKKRG